MVGWSGLHELQNPEMLSVTLLGTDTPGHWGWGGADRPCENCEIRSKTISGPRLSHRVSEVFSKNLENRMIISNVLSSNPHATASNAMNDE